MTSLFPFVVLLMFPTLGTANHDALVIRRCVKQTANNVSRPSVSPRVCLPSSNAAYCETLFGLENKTLAQNTDNNKDYKVSKLCYDPTLSMLSSRCRSYCNLCCEDPQYNCEDDADEEACLTLLENKLCENPIVLETARKRCPRTCGLCDQRSMRQPNVSGSLYCPDKFKMCDMLHDIIPCNNPVMLCFCANTCRRVNCECNEK